MTTPLKGNKFVSILNLETFRQKVVYIQNIIFHSFEDVCCCQQQIFQNLPSMMTAFKNAKFPFSSEFRNFWHKVFNIQNIIFYSLENACCCQLQIFQNLWSTMTTPLKGNKFISILNFEIFDTKQLSFKTLFFIHWKMSKKNIFQNFQSIKRFEKCKTSILSSI